MDVRLGRAEADLWDIHQAECRSGGARNGHRARGTVRTIGRGACGTVRTMGMVPAAHA
jgi:hypothetical protein